MFSIIIYGHGLEIGFNVVVQWLGLSLILKVKVYCWGLLIRLNTTFRVNFKFIFLF
jgi:hypothetical protein